MGTGSITSIYLPYIALLRVASIFVSYTKSLGPKRRAFVASDCAKYHPRPLTAVFTSPDQATPGVDSFARF
ncbi:hypothetical protein N431DRAFT_426738 [Stipitochalara longipes BDJ]|nr:hypothetical protein N431DRAFT_426738 [Stipitochalara longipes BDJ]